jgi:ATP-binding cassette subfamily B (MDR/TAP) protein 1
MGFCFSVAGARLVERVRRAMFQSMLNQDIGWFDQEENNTGALCARLSTSADAVASAGGGKIGAVLR